jgi:Tfp pilus assembly protein PilO
MKHLEKQQIIIIAAALVLTTSFTLLRFMPMAKRKAKLAEAKETTIIESESLKVKSASLESMRKELARLQSDLVNYDRQIPTGRNFAELWKQVAGVMKDHGLSEQLVKPETEIHGEIISCIPISLQCSGSLDQIFKLFDSLAQLDRLIRVEDVQLLNDSDYTGNVRMQAKANVYYAEGS